MGFWSIAFLLSMTAVLTIKARSPPVTPPVNNLVLEPLNICALPAEPGIPGTGIMCAAYFPKWYYDSEKGKCKTFIFGGCGGNANQFDTKDECEDTCPGDEPEPVPEDICTLPAEPGVPGTNIVCMADFPRWYYNSEEGKCKTFTFGGCGGNDNQFHTKDECEDTCPGDDD